jgi:hypothetical protein
MRLTFHPRVEDLGPRLAPGDLLGVGTPDLLYAFTTDGPVLIGDQIPAAPAAAPGSPWVNHSNWWLGPDGGSIRGGANPDGTRILGSGQLISKFTVSFQPFDPVTGDAVGPVQNVSVHVNAFAGIDQPLDKVGTAQQVAAAFLAAGVDAHVAISGNSVTVAVGGTNSAGTAYVVGITNETVWATDMNGTLMNPLSQFDAVITAY